MATKNPFLKAYTIQKSNSKRRGIEFLFTFEEWSQWWLDTGKWEQRGKGRDKYCMQRYNDTGPYSPSNVYCGTNSENVSLGNKGKIVSQETKSRMSKAGKGKSKPWVVGDKNPMHRHEVKAKMSALIGGANHYKARGVMTPIGFFCTAKEAAKAMGISKSTIEWRARRNKLGFSYGAKAA
jgi:hypothetical protein